MIAANWQPIKEPRGFIRVVQVLFALIAFATTGGFEKDVRVSVACPNNTVVNVAACTDDFKIEYPFRNNRNVGLCSYKRNCTGDTAVPDYELDISYGTSSEFYVTTGVLSFLYASFALAFYTFGSVLYEENPILPFFDLIATALLTLFWFLGWIAWVTQVGNLRDQFNDLSQVITDHVGHPAICTVSAVKFSRLTISLISGFGSLILWAGSSWFVYKETILFKKNDVVHYGTDIQPNRPAI